MFNQIFDAIEEWMRELLTGMINSNLDRMFTDVNQKTSEIAGQVGQTPQGWNGSIFSMIEGLSNSVIMPIAGIIITFVLCYELISMLSNVADKSVIAELISMDVSPETSPAAEFTTLCPTSKTAIVMVNVLLTR